MPLILNYGIRLGVVGAGVANAPAPGGILTIQKLT